jgi:hypothetical protein
VSALSGKFARDFLGWENAKAQKVIMIMYIFKAQENQRFSVENNGTIREKFRFHATLRFALNDKNS